jgi:hypothetical protein
MFSDAASACCAILKAADLCASDPNRAARLLVEQGYTKRDDYALQALSEIRDYATGELASTNSSISRSLLRRTTGICAPYFRRSASIRGRRSAL